MPGKNGFIYLQYMYNNTEWNTSPNYVVGLIKDFFLFPLVFFLLAERVTTNILQTDYCSLFDYFIKIHTGFEYLLLEKELSLVPKKYIHIAASGLAPHKQFLPPNIIAQEGNPVLSVILIGRSRFPEIKWQTP